MGDEEFSQILVNTLVGRYLPAYRKRPTRLVIQAPNFYIPDVGVVNLLTHHGRLEPGLKPSAKTPLLGKDWFAFGHAILVGKKVADMKAAGVPEEEIQKFIADAKLKWEHQQQQVKVQTKQK